MDKYSSLRRNLYLTTRNTHNRRTPTPPPGFGPTIRASERLWTQGLDHAASRMGYSVNITHILIIRVVDSRADKHHVECVSQQYPENRQEPQTMETTHGVGHN